MIRVQRSLLLVAALSVVSINCAKKEGGEPPAPDITVSGEGHHSSPWEWGPSVRLTYPIPLTIARTSLHPMASYTYLKYDGGHEDRIDAGLQIRRSMGETAAPWIGAEVAVAYMRDKYTGGSESDYGPSLTALIGLPIIQNRWNPQFVAGAGVSHYGSSGVNVRAGLSLTPF